GYYRYSKDLDVYKKLLLVGEALREKDSAFSEILMADIEYAEERLLKIPEGYLYKAMILKEKGEFEAARVALNEYFNKGGKETAEIQVLNEDINNIADYEKAIALLENNPAKSIEILLRLANDFDENPLLYYYLGVAFRRLENYDKAIYYLEESIRRESGILEVVVELGLNYACIGEYQKAIDLFKKAFEASRDVEICTNIIMCYLNIGDMENAKIHLEIAKKLNPEDEIVKQIEEVIKNK
ncbi:tetratricopeptide repeat protein, partial [Clostridium saudiense]|nr:tetratricopeptide repeat protein [Clostridium saudiense]